MIRPIRRSLRVGGLVLVTALITGPVGVWLGVELTQRWPLQSVEHALGLRMRGWRTATTSDMPRVESATAQVGDRLIVFGGFVTADLRASARVDAFDLVTETWTKQPALPVVLTHANAASLESEVWLAGGFTGDHPGPASAMVWRFDLTGGSWRSGPELPTVRAAGLLAAHADTLHYIGGFGAQRKFSFGDHWTLEPGQETWAPAPPLPRARGHASGATVGETIFLIGGSEEHDPNPIDLKWVDLYDTRTRLWKQGPNLPFGLSHNEGATIVYDGGILIAGGRSLPSGRPTLDDLIYLAGGADKWVHVGRLPRRAMGGVLAERGDTLWAGLGAQSGSTPGTVNLWRRPLRNAWYPADPMPEELGEVSAGVIDGHMYVVGERSAQTLSYDLASGLWNSPTSLPSRPSDGHHHAAEVYDGKLFLLGGLGGWGGSEGLVQIFDPNAQEWTLGPEMPFAVGSASSALINGRIFVAGGIANGTTVPSAAFLDPETRTWTSLPDMPVGRNHAASGTDGQRFFVFGGRGPGSGDANVVADGFDDVQIFDPRTGLWTASDGSPGAPLPLPQRRGGMGKAVYVNGEFWVMGGETLKGEGATSKRTYARVDIYDPVANQWRRGPDLPTARHGIFPIEYGHQIIVAGGGTEAAYSASDVVEVLWPR